MQFLKERNLLKINKFLLPCLFPDRFCADIHTLHASVITLIEYLFPVFMYARSLEKAGN